MPFRIRVGPISYSPRRRRRAQSYGAYKKSRNRRAAYAARYEHERSEGSGSSPNQIGLVLVVVLLSPIIVPVYLIRRLVRAIRGGPVLPDTGVVGVRPGEGTRVADHTQLRVDQRPARVREQRQPRQTAAVRETLQPRGSTIRGRTTAEFDGVTLPTLRAWLKFWTDERRSAGRAEEMAREDPTRFRGRTREHHIRMIELEIAARERA